MSTYQSITCNLHSEGRWIFITVVIHWYKAKGIVSTTKLVTVVMLGSFDYPFRPWQIWNIEAMSMMQSRGDNVWLVLANSTFWFSMFNNTSFKLLWIDPVVFSSVAQHVCETDNKCSIPDDHMTYHSPSSFRTFRFRGLVNVCISIIELHHCPTCYQISTPLTLHSQWPNLLQQTYQSHHHRMSSELFAWVVLVHCWYNRHW